MSQPDHPSTTPSSTPETFDEYIVEPDEAAYELADDDELPPAPFIAPGQTSRKIRGALLRYRVMAYLVGVLLVVLMVVGLPMKYIWDNDLVVRATGIPHGWLYMVLLITAYDLGRRVRWTWPRLILIALAGTVPFLSFVAERSATKDVRHKLIALDEAERADRPTDD